MSDAREPIARAIQMVLHSRLLLGLTFVQALLTRLADLVVGLLPAFGIPPTPWVAVAAETLTSVGTLFLSIAVIYAAWRIVIGDGTELRWALDAARNRFWTVILIMLVMAIVIVVLLVPVSLLSTFITFILGATLPNAEVVQPSRIAVLLIATVLGLIVGFWVSFAECAAITEDRSAGSALHRATILLGRLGAPMRAYLLWGAGFFVVAWMSYFAILWGSVWIANHTAVTIAYAMPIVRLVVLTPLQAIAVAVTSTWTVILFLMFAQRPDEMDSIAGDPLDPTKVSPVVEEVGYGIPLGIEATADPAEAPA